MPVTWRSPRNSLAVRYGLLSTPCAADSTTLAGALMTESVEL